MKPEIDSGVEAISRRHGVDCLSKSETLWYRRQETGECTERNNAYRTYAIRPGGDDYDDDDNDDVDVNDG